MSRHGKQLLGENGVRERLHGSHCLLNVERVRNWNEVRLQLPRLTVERNSCQLHGSELLLQLLSWQHAWSTQLLHSRSQTQLR